MCLGGKDRGGGGGGDEDVNSPPHGDEPLETSTAGGTVTGLFMESIAMNTAAFILQRISMKAVATKIRWPLLSRGETAWGPATLTQNPRHPLAKLSGGRKQACRWSGPAYRTVIHHGDCTMN